MSLFFRDHLWERLAANVGIVLVFVAFYFRFVSGRWRAGSAAFAPLGNGVRLESRLRCDRAVGLSPGVARALHSDEIPIDAELVRALVRPGDACLR